MRKCKNVLQAFVEYASYSEAPLHTLFWTGVSCVAGAMRRKVWMDMKYFRWYPNFYIIIVAPPGIISKSTTVSIGMKLLRRVPDIKFGPDVITWPALTQYLTTAKEEVMVPGDGPQTMSAITIESSEFGNLLDPLDREMVDMYVSLWDNKEGVFSKVTKTQGEDTIENPWINLIACTTPAWISGNFPEYMIGGGFTSRCVFVYAEQKRQLVAYPDQGVPKDFETLADNIVHDLTEISQMAGQFTLTADAREWGEHWYEQHYAKPNTALDPTRFGGYLARKQTHMHKLAMVLSAARRSNLVITQEDLFKAERMLTMLEPSLANVFSKIGQTESSQHLEVIKATIAQHSPISLEDLLRRCGRIIGDVTIMDRAIKTLKESGYITVNIVDEKMYFKWKPQKHEATEPLPEDLAQALASPGASRADASPDFPDDS